MMSTLIAKKLFDFYDFHKRVLRLLGLADDLDIIGETLEDISNAARVLEKEANKIGLQISANKTKVMELINSGVDLADSEGLAYEKVDDFKYLGATLNTENDWSKEIDIRLNKAEKNGLCSLEIVQH